MRLVRNILAGLAVLVVVVVAMGGARSGDDADLRRAGGRRRRENELDERQPGGRFGHPGDRRERADERVRVALDFDDMGNGTAGFTLTPEGDGTKTAWDFRTDLGNNPVARYFGLMIDTWIDADREKSLAKLKAMVEGQP